MASLSPSALHLETRPLELARSDVLGPAGGPAAEAASKLQARQEAQRNSELDPGNLTVQLDKSAMRFVQTLTDAATHETLLRYPSEGQLAYSRAVKAYFRAQTES